MGLLVEGVWHDKWYDTKKNEGKFVREDSQFRHWLTPEQVSSGRYHLFVSLACPWAHRAIIYRELKQLTAHIGITVVDPVMLANGWEFSQLSHNNPVADVNYLYQVYVKSQSDYSGRVTVPVLWDKQEEKIVNNESSDIIRMLNSDFNHLTDNKDDYYPEALRPEINRMNQLVYEAINNGVYKCGFATSQAAYDQAVEGLFVALDSLEQHLGQHRYLVGDQLTEADWRLFTTLIRFDAVYVGHFKTNLRRLIDFPNLWGYVKDCYQTGSVAKTVDFDHIKTHYYVSHPMINPTQIIPKGPLLDFTTEHLRERVL